MKFNCYSLVAILFIGGALWVGLTHTVAPVLGASPAAFRDAAGAAVSISGTYRFVTSRDAKSNTLQIALPAARAAVEFRVLPEERPERATYRATLNSVPAVGATTTVGIVDSLHEDTEGFVRVFADSARLPPGAYELEALIQQQDLPESYRNRYWTLTVPETGEGVTVTPTEPEDMPEHGTGLQPEIVLR